jgi:hypothetical protein
LGLNTEPITKWLLEKLDDCLDKNDDPRISSVITSFGVAEYMRIFIDLGSPSALGTNARFVNLAMRIQVITTADLAAAFSSSEYEKFGAEVRKAYTKEFWKMLKSTEYANAADKEAYAMSLSPELGKSFGRYLDYENSRGSGTREAGNAITGAERKTTLNEQDVPDGRAREIVKDGNPMKVLHGKAGDVGFFFKPEDLNSNGGTIISTEGLFRITEFVPRSTNQKNGDDIIKTQGMYYLGTTGSLSKEFDQMYSAHYPGYYLEDGEMNYWNAQLGRYVLLFVLTRFYSGLYTAADGVTNFYFSQGQEGDSAGSVYEVWATNPPKTITRHKDDVIGTYGMGETDNQLFYETLPKEVAANYLASDVVFAPHIKEGKHGIMRVTIQMRLSPEYLKRADIIIVKQENHIISKEDKN